MKRIITALAVIVAMTACNQNPFLSEWDTPYGIPPFDKIHVSDYVPAVKYGIRQQSAEIDAIILNSEEPTFENVVAAYDRSGAVLGKVQSVLFNLSESDGTDALIKVVEEVTPMLSEHSDNIFMNRFFFEKVKAVYDKRESLGLTVEQNTYLKDLYDSFIQNGVALDEDAQAKLRDVNTELSNLYLQFGNNLLAESNAFTAEFGMSVSEYYPFMGRSEDRKLREKVFKAYSNRGNNGNEYDNKAVVEKIMKLRIERANILGFATPADMILENTMAKKSSAVDSFLAEIMDAAVARAKEEVADMQAVMDKDIAAGLLPAGSTIQPWDYLYYSERVRKERFNLDEEQYKPYFKMENVRKGVFDNASRLYGLQFKPVTGVALYNPEAEAFEVTDADGSLIGVIITDYYPRPIKRGGAWMSNFTDQYIADGVNVRPVIVNIGNFTKPTADAPSLLTLDEVETMFHEFGHALHGLLSQCTYRGTSGTNVKRDFVELPSQINENWAFQKEVLATYAFHYETGEVIPDDLVDKIIAAGNFNQGFMTTELVAASILDMKWHELSSMDGITVESFEKKVCDEIGLIDEIIPRYRSTYFNHIFGSSGYSAGYYSYLWAEVLDKDAFDLFLENGIYDQATATSFRRNILEKGGSDDPMVMYKRFRGADPDPAALLRARGLK